METTQQAKPAKSNQVITTTVTGSTITFNVRDTGQVVLDLSTIHPDVLQRAALHGMIQRISDRAAIGRNPETGKPASPAEKLAAMQALAAHYAAGSADWSPARSEGGGNEGGITLRALARVQGVEVDVMRARVAEQAEKRGITPKAYLARVAGAEAVVRAIAAIRAESGDAGQADAMLDELAA